ncbi:acetate--CoA ligase family protein [Novosphingobium malaysiense]|uniref:ATP-grasp domain-containing protein n=1 Tax=Novosphingobium malaysiense TaxID=1348853 RepID=A0A0B1ZH21_9SPHN|nr:acetate--CoA ligase family protein [Novosphingobium malaysiense]KHK89807.1 hypothetical protein LK12_17945 [Novosphingobium malaysiense]
MDLKSLDVLLKPRSVAVIGASDNPHRLPGMSLAYMKLAGFEGDLWPVNPKRETVQGLKAYPSVDDLPGTPDVAIIATPAHLVQQAVEDCSRLGVGAVVIFAVGYSEANEEGRKAEQALLDAARKSGMRVLGPNCLGCFNAATGYYGTISISLASGLPTAGNVAVVSQSGAYGEQLAYLLKERGVGVRYLVTTGNACDVDVGSAIDWMAAQDDVDVIVGYAEGVGDRDRFVSALERAQAAGKQLVFMKVGQSETGMAAAMSHTASLAGDDKVWDAVLRKYGAYRPVSTEEQVDIAYAASRGLLPAGRKLGILTVSGGFGIQLCDAADQYGLEVAPLRDEVARELTELLPFGSINNPVDASGQIVGELERLKASIACLSDPAAGYDATAVILGSVPLGPGMGTVLVDALLELAPTVRDRLVALCCVADRETVLRVEQAGYLVFADVHDAARAIAALATLSEYKSRQASGAIALPSPIPRGGKLSEFDAKRVLEAAGLPVPPERLARSADEAVAAADAIGYPVVLKVCSPDILHKTEIGGILLNLPDASAVREGYATLVERAASAGFAESALQGILVTGMAPRGTETILGVQVDPTFGSTVLFGLGGIHVEVMKDSALRLAPVSEEEAHEMIREIKSFPLLNGVRGSRPSDLDTLARAIASLSRFAAANADTITSVDVNPFVVWEEGKGGAALDALISVRED